MLRSMAKALVSITMTRVPRLIGAASSPIACAMRTKRPSLSDHAASIDRSRSRRASISCRGMTMESFGCQTWTSGSSSGFVLPAAMRRDCPAASSAERFGVPRRNTDEEERAIVGPLRDAEANHAKVGGEAVVRCIQLARSAGGGRHPARPATCESAPRARSRERSATPRAPPSSCASSSRRRSTRRNRARATHRWPCRTAAHRCRRRFQRSPQMPGRCPCPARRFQRRRQTSYRGPLRARGRAMPCPAEPVRYSYSAQGHRPWPRAHTAASPGACRLAKARTTRCPRSSSCDLSQARAGLAAFESASSLSEVWLPALR